MTEQQLLAKGIMHMEDIAWAVEFGWSVEKVIENLQEATPRWIVEDIYHKEVERQFREIVLEKPLGRLIYE